MFTLWDSQAHFLWDFQLSLNFPNTFRIPTKIYVGINIFIRSLTEIPIGILNEISFNGSSPAIPGSSSNHDDAAEDNVH